MGLSRKVSKKPQFIVTKNAAVWHFWLLVLSTLFKSPLNFIDTNLIKANFQVLLFHRSRRGFPSLLRYGQRRRVTDTVVLVFFFFSLVSISKYMLFLVYVWTARPHRGAFAAFPKPMTNARQMLQGGGRGVGGGEDADVRLELWLTHKA